MRWHRPRNVSGNQVREGGIMNSRGIIDLVSSFPTASFALRLLMALAIVEGVSIGNTPPATFFALTPGTGLNSTQILVALPIQNLGPADVTNVMVTDLKLKSEMQLSPAVLPVGFGNLAGGKTFLVDAAFNGTQLVGGTTYMLTVHGTYVVAGQKFGWVVQTTVIMPKASGGSATANTTTLPSFNTAGAPFPAKPISTE